MSKTTSEFDNFNNISQQIIDEDNGSNADSPLQFFDDHVTFNYTPKEYNVDEVSKMPSTIIFDKTQEFDSLNGNSEFNHLTGDINENISSYKSIDIDSSINNKCDTAVIKAESENFNNNDNNYFNNRNLVVDSVLISNDLPIEDNTYFSNSISEENNVFESTDLIPESVEANKNMLISNNDYVFKNEETVPEKVNICIVNEAFSDLITSNNCSKSNDVISGVKFEFSNEISNVIASESENKAYFNELNEKLESVLSNNNIYDESKAETFNNYIHRTDLDSTSIDNSLNIDNTQLSINLKSETIPYINDQIINNFEVSSANNNEIPLKRTYKSRKSMNTPTSTYKLRSSLTKIEMSHIESPTVEAVKTTRKRRLSKLNTDELTFNDVNHELIKEKVVKNRKSEIEIKKSKTENCIPKRTSTRIEKRLSTKKENIESEEETISKKEPKILKRIGRPSKNQEEDQFDPGNWPQNLPNNLKTIILKHGPVQIDNIEFPRNERRKCFTSNNYLIKSPSGTKYRRNWLTYSLSQDSAFCFPCRIFSYNSPTTLANKGSKNWKKITERLLVHDTSSSHMDSMEQWASATKEIDGIIGVSTLTTSEALQLAKSVKSFLASKEDKLFLLARQLVSELEVLNTIPE